MATFIPVLFVIFYKFMDVGLPAEDKPAWLLGFGMLMNAAMGGMLVVGTSIAEEKEKHTLRTLRMANVSGGDFFLGKILGGLVIAIGGALIVFFLSGVDVSTLPAYAVANLLGCGSILMLSAWIGLLSRDQMTCGVYQIPVMLLFMLPAIFGDRSTVIGWIGKGTPIYNMIYFYNSLAGKGFSQSLIFPISVLILWLIIGTMLFLLTYRKQDMDN